MKVTHIIIGLGIGGAEIALKNIAEYAKKHELFTSRVIILSSIGAVDERLQAADIEVISLNMRGFADIPRVIFSLVKLLKAQKPDAVQTWMYHSDLLGGIAARLAGIKNIFWGVRSTDILATGGISRETRFIMKLCSFLSYIIPRAVVCVASSAQKSHIGFGYDKSKMLIINNGYDSDTYSKKPASRANVCSQHLIPEGAVVIGSVGRFNEYKDYPNFIEAAAKLAKRRDNLYFLMVGRDITTDNAELMALITKSGVAERFILAGQQTDLPAYYSAMDIFCLHSKSEAFPNVVVEAMCCEAPCVATDVGDAAVILGDAGIVVPAENADSLAEALEKMLRLSEVERAEIGRKSRERVIKNYSLDIVVRKYQKLYRNIEGNIDSGAN